MTDSGRHLSSATPAEQKLRLGADFPLLLVAGCTLFNAALCFANTSFMAVSPAMVILSEVILIGLSTAYDFFRLSRANLFWLFILAMQILLVAILSAGKGELLAKSLRDVLIMPVFIVLGLAAWRANVTRFLFVLCGVVFAFSLLEAFSISKFTQFFNVRDYFIAKGSDLDFTYAQNGLFISSMRPSGRFFLNIPGLHRVSSLFLEPISLGFFGFSIGLYFISVKDRVSKSAYAAGLFFSLFFIWISDARMALGSLAVVFFARPLWARLDHRLAVLFLPSVLLLSSLLYAEGFLRAEGEGIGARLYSSMYLLSHTNLEILAGVGSFYPLTSLDCALGDLLGAQGVLGVLLYWLPPIFFARRLPAEARIYSFGVSFYLLFGFLLSPAIFSIKTAALIWFLYGYLIARYMLHEHELPDLDQRDVS